MHDTSSATIRTIGNALFDTKVVADSTREHGCHSNVNSEFQSWIMSAFIAFLLVAIIAWMLIVARRRDRRLQRRDDRR